MMSTTTDTDLDTLGPVDYLVVEFPGGISHFTGEMATELARLVDAGTIRILDLLVMVKGEDGEIEGMEIEDLEQVDELRKAEADLAEILAAEDLVNLAAAMEPGTTAGVLVWENTWAAPFASAARRSGAQLIANGRIPIQALLAALDADDTDRRRLKCHYDQYVWYGAWRHRCTGCPDCRRCWHRGPSLFDARSATARRSPRGLPRRPATTVAAPSLIESPADDVIV